MNPSNDPKDVAGIIVHAFLLFLVVAAVASVFGLLWWRRLKRREERRVAELAARLAERRAKREGATKDPAKP